MITRRRRPLRPKATAPAGARREDRQAARARQTAPRAAAAVRRVAARPAPVLGAAGAAVPAASPFPHRPAVRPERARRTAHRVRARTGRAEVRGSRGQRRSRPAVGTLGHRTRAVRPPTGRLGRRLPHTRPGPTRGAGAVRPRAERQAPNSGAARRARESIRRRDRIGRAARRAQRISVARSSAGRIRTARASHYARERRDRCCRRAIPYGEIAAIPYERRSVPCPSEHPVGAAPRERRHERRMKRSGPGSPPKLPGPVRVAGAGQSPNYPAPVQRFRQALPSPKATGGAPLERGSPIRVLLHKACGPRSPEEHLQSTRGHVMGVSCEGGFSPYRT